MDKLLCYFMKLFRKLFLYNLYYYLNKNIKRPKFGKLFNIFFILGIGDWGLGIGDWGLGPIPNPQSPIPNPQSPKF